MTQTILVLLIVLSAVIYLFIHFFSLKSKRIKKTDSCGCDQCPISKKRK